jgi:hypothetical protein
MRLDFIRTLRGADESEWPEIYIFRDEEGGASSQPLCFASESESADAMNCIGLARAWGRD